MTKNTVGAQLAGMPVALSAHHAAPMLQATMPDLAARGEAGAAAHERFTVSRGVAVVPIRGLLTPNVIAFERWFGWTTYQGLEETLGELSANEDVRAIALAVDSPGGMVMGLESAAAALSAIAAKKPVYAHADPLAASAAYWLASQAGEISMARGAVVGSIGVAVSAYSEVEPHAGRQWFDITSSHARAKWPEPATEDGRAEIMRSLDETEARFHAAVAKGRGIPADELTTRLSVTDDPQDGGAVFYAEEAIRRGLADKVESRAEFFARVFAEHAPGTKTKSRAFLARAAAAQARAKS